MSSHTRTDGLPETAPPEIGEAAAEADPTTMATTAAVADARAPATLPEIAQRARPRNERMAGGKVECNACPVLCQISPGRSGACDRYANQDGRLIRVDPVVLLRRTLSEPEPAVVSFAPHTAPVEGRGAGKEGLAASDWNGDLLRSEEVFVTGIGSSTTYPDYKPAPFIVASRHDGVDMVTVVTEGIFSYCSLKVKIDTDRYLGPEQADVRCRGEVIGHVTTAEYGSQMLSLGGVHHLTGGSKKEGRITLEAMTALGNRQPVELEIDRGSQVTVQAGARPSSTASRSSACGWGAARRPSGSSPASSSVSSTRWWWWTTTSPAC